VGCRCPLGAVQINAFVQLQKRIGWTVPEIDQIRTAFDASALKAEFLGALGLVKTLHNLTNTTFVLAVVFSRDIPTVLYEKLFLKPSVLAGNPGFARGEKGGLSFEPGGKLQDFN